jgi:hypothetical protein
MKMRLHQEPLPLKPEGGSRCWSAASTDVSNSLIDLHAWRVVVGAEEESYWWACDANA